MSTTGTALIDAAARLLSDQTNVRWLRTELLAYLNEAMRQVTLVQPQSNNTTASVALVEGTRQTLPTGGWMLLDAYRNMGTGAVPGRAVRGVSRSLMDAFDPSWHTARKTKVVKAFIVDAQDKTHYWVSPPSDGTNFLEINYAIAPTPLTVEGSNIPLNDIYSAALIEYMLYRAHSKPVDGSGGPTVASAYLANFGALLGVKDASEQANNAGSAVGQRGGDAPGANS